MADVFISYSRKDKDFVQRLDESLKSRGREAWVDWEGIRPTEEFMQAIYGAIEGVDTFVFVLTPDSVASVVCGREITHATLHNKRMVPIVARDVDASAVPEALAKLNWIFCRESDDFEKATDTLITAFDTDLDWVHAHTRLLTRAIEWEAKGKNNSFVLRGEDLRAAEQWLAQAGTEKERQPTALQTEYIIASRKAAARRQRITLGAVTFGLIVSIILAVIAFYQRNIAEDRRRVAQARQLEAQARVALDSSGEGLQKSALLAVESLKSAWTADGYIACARALSILPRRPKLRPAHQTKVLALALSTDGRLLASLDDVGTVVVWDQDKEVARLKPKNPEHELYGDLTLSPDGKWLVSTSGRAALVWDAATWQRVKELPHGDIAWSVAFSPAGDLLATTSYQSRQIKVYRPGTWDEVPAWSELTEKETEEGLVRAVAFSPNGQCLVTAGSSLLTTWEIPVPKKLKEIKVTQPWSLAFRHNGESVAIGGEMAGRLQLQKLDGAQAESFGGHSQRILNVAFSRDDRYLASASLDETVRIWDVEDKRELLRLPQKASAVVFTPDGSAVITGNDDGTLAEWPITRGTAIKTLPSESVVKAVTFSNDGQFLILGSADGQMRILKTEAGRWGQIATKAPGTEISTLGLSPDGRWLVAITGKSAQLYSIPGWMEASPSLDFGEDSMDAVLFSPDGKWIALQTRRHAPGGAHGDLMTTRVFELATRRVVAWLTHTNLLNVPASELTSGGDLKLVANAASWAEMRLGGRSAKSSDGRWETFNQKGTLIDAQLQRPAEIAQHDGPVTDAAFSPNGRWLVTSSEDRTVCVWPLRTEDLLPEVMPRLQRNLTYAEWQQSFSDQPYQKTCPDLPIHPSFVEAGRMLAEKGDVKGATAIFRRAMELQPDLKLDPKAEAQRLAEGAKRANATKITEQRR
ncbi:MAG TPA: TIR domain-containing protein [Candidatus Limnocylindria bacterium]|jgi:WD40 repeat protein|nr:TIR domain-containing protein [Candidatus Limnocylindria bacterium]